MTAFDIYSALGNVSEDILEESETVPKKKTAKIIPLMAAAACFAVFAFGISHALRNDGIEQPVTETAFPESYSLLTGIVWSDTITNDVTESEQILTDIEILYTAPNVTTETAEKFTEPYPAVTEGTTVCPTDTTVNLTTVTSAPELVHSDEAEDPDRYSYLDYNGAVYSRTLEKFDESELTFLQNGELYDLGSEEAYDDEDYAGHKRYTIPCAFYKIKNVNENYMIAAFTAGGNYAAFKNYGFFPDTLGGYLEDIDFYNRAKLMTTIGSYTWDENGTSTFSECYMRDVQQAVEKFLAENSDALPEANIPPVLGRYTINCRNGSDTAVMICDGGYIMVGGVFFNIGEDKTESFMKYIKENAVRDDADETIPE